MKKITSLFVFLLTIVIGFSSFVVFADYKAGDELVTNGDFEFTAGELAFPDPVFGSEYGVAEGWGSLAFDSAAIAIEDPDDSSNTILKLSLSDEGQNWSSFFRFLTINQSTTYDISIDFKIVGTTDNIGFRFAGAPALETVFLNDPSKTAITGKTDWYNVQFQFDTAAGTYDSIALWFNTMGSTDNYALLDNISVKESGSSTELNIGGDFEGFLDYAPGLTLTDTVNSYGFFGTLASVGDGDGVINDGGYIGYELAMPTAMYQAQFDFTIDDLTNADATLSFYDDSDTLITSEPIITSGVADADNTTLDGSVYHFDADVDLTDAASYFTIDYSGDSSLVIDNLSMKELQEIPDNPFDPDTTYYEVNQYLVNGDFEAFAVDTQFSEEQLEGAWGSISLDGPATIKDVDSSHVMSLGKTDGKMYTSAFVITPPELMVDDLLRLRFDYKLDLESDLSAINVANVSFVGASNEDYFTINLKNLADGNMTAGYELLNMPISLTDNGNGWYTVEVDFQVTTAFLIKCNSIRFLFTPLTSSDFLYVDNVELWSLSDVEPTNNATGLAIDQADQELYVDDQATLTATVTPSDADNAIIEWSTSDADVVTVDENGNIVAVAKGAATITVSLEDGSLTDSIVVTVLEPESAWGIWGILGTVLGGLVVVGAGVLIFIKRR